MTLPLQGRGRRFNSARAHFNKLPKLNQAILIPMVTFQIVDTK
jgi:hypothetical protein